MKNAIYYEKNGFGYLIEERDISKKLFQLIKQISENNNLLDQIKAKQRQHSDKTVYEPPNVRRMNWDDGHGGLPERMASLTGQPDANMASCITSSQALPRSFSLL